MTATEFIKSNLYKFISEFPHAKVSYEHEIICNTHYIQIEPSSLYNDDTDYINWEERTTLDFIDKYSSENICFVTNDSIVTITNSEFELIGNQYLNYFLPD